MNTRLYTFSFCLLFMSTVVSAQQFLNSQLEPAGGGLTACSYNNLALYNVNMGNTWAIGSSPQIYFADNSCTMAPAYAGTHFVGIATNSTGFNTIVLKLNTPMTAATAYTFNFYYKYAGGTTACPLQYGYTNDSLTSDSLVGSIIAPPSTSWTIAGGSLTPAIASQYIWIRGDNTTGVTGVTYVDSFHMKGIPNVAVQEVPKNSAMNIFPNPFSNATQIDIDASINLPCRMAIYDITGRMVIQNLHITEREFIVNRREISTGIYYIQLTDDDNNSYFSKLIAK